MNASRASTRRRTCHQGRAAADIALPSRRSLPASCVACAGPRQGTNHGSLSVDTGCPRSGNGCHSTAHLTTRMSFSSRRWGDPQAGLHGPPGCGSDTAPRHQHSRRATFFRNHDVRSPRRVASACHLDVRSYPDRRENLAPNDLRVGEDQGFVESLRGASPARHSVPRSKIEGGDA